MKLKREKAIALILAVMLFAIPLSACGGGGGTAEQTPDFVYVPTYSTLPAEVENMGNTTYANGVLYFYMSKPYDKQGNPLTREQVKKIDEEYSKVYESMNSSASSTSESVKPEYDPGYKYVPGLFSMNTDGTGLKEFTAYKPISVGDVMASLNCFAVDASGNIWTVECVSERRGESYRETYFLRHLNPDGSEASSIPISDILEQTSDYLYINSIKCDKDGNVYLNSGDIGIVVLDPNGQKLFNATSDGWVSNMLSMSDGTVAAIYNSREGGGVTLKVIDPKTKGFGAEYDAPLDAYQTFPGGKDYDFCYNGSYSLMGYKSSTEKSEEILNWINCDISGDGINFAMVEDDGDVLAISSNWDDQMQASKTELITLKKTPYSQVEKKTNLTLATMWLDYNIKSKVVNFNKTNSKYRIQIRDYSQYNTENDYSAGLTKLNTEIISGNIPDIIDVSQLPYEQYAAKGLLADLYTCIDGDKVVTRDSFIQSVLKTMESADGKLYLLSPSFSIQSMIGSSKVVGEEMGWTIEEMQACLAEHPEADYPFGQYVSRETILMYFCMMNMENYMEWETGKCSFNSDEFKNMLTLAKSFPEKVDYSEENAVNTSELLSSGRQIFEFFTAYDLQTQQYFEAVFGGDITFKGIPTADRAGNLVAMSGGSLSITTSCKDKAGAWEFMRTLYLPEYQDKLYGFPVRQSSFDKKLADAMDKDKNTGGGMAIDGGMTVEFGPLNQKEADQFVALVDSVRHTVVYNDSLMNIIKEEAAAFFKGEKTVDQVADIIQSRMTIYVNEQR